MADLATVKAFFENADAHAAFSARAAAALVEWAATARAAATPNPVTEQWRSRQDYARIVLNAGPAGVLRIAQTLLPALAIRANDAGLLSDQGLITATDTQIRATIDDDFVDLFTGYIPEAT